VLLCSNGDIAGSEGTRQWRVKLHTKSIPVHTIIYELMFGKMIDGNLVDHKDGNPLNNEITNLRQVSVSINNRNKRKASNNVSGYTGVFKTKISGNEYWVSIISLLNGKRKKKYFSISKYGNDALSMAIVHRDKLINDLNTEGAEYSERHGK
jgi:hypothetical protein